MAASFAAGVLAADVARPAAWAALPAGWLGLGLLVAAWRRHRQLPAPGPGELLPRLRAAGAAALLAGAALLGFADLGLRSAARERSALPELAGRVVPVTALVASDPRPVGRAWDFMLRSVAVGDRGATGRLMVRSYGSIPAVDLGDRLRLEAKIVPLDPGDPFDERLWRRGVVARAIVAGEIEVVERAGGALLVIANHFRNRMFEGARAVLPEERTGLLMGLVIGDDRFTGDRIKDDFRAAGLSHLTAVSGANLAMVLAALAVLLGALRVGRKLQIVFGLAVIVLFAVITRWEPSVLRASIMAALALAAFLFGRLSNPLHALGVAFVGLLAYDPMLLWSIGFQLSFAATAGILLLRKPLLRRMPSVRPLIAEPVAIGVAAQVAVFPLIALHFDRISIAALPANLAAVALVPPVTILGLVAGVVASASPWLAGPLVWLAGGFVWGLEWVARIFGRSDGAQLAVPNFGWLQATGWYLVIAALWMALAGRLRRARWPAVLAVLLLSGAAVLPALGRTPPDGLRITFLDVGAGDAALVESPGGARVLIDGGPDPEQVAATLRRWGYNRIDLVVATHLHADHVTGLRAVMDSMDVSLALFSGVGVPQFGWIGPELGWEVVGDGHVLRLGDLELVFLGPGRDIREAASSAVEIDPEDGTALNDSSVVLRVNWGDECVLLPADVEEQGQQDLLERRSGDLECTIAKAPHHGSGRLLPEFVEAMDAEWVAVSVGPNRHGHPTDKALDLFEGAGGRLLRTDRLDDVVLEMDRNGAVRAP